MYMYMNYFVYCTQSYISGRLPEKVGVFGLSSVEGELKLECSISVQESLNVAIGLIICGLVLFPDSGSNVK